MVRLTREQMIIEIQHLEIQISKLEQEQGGKYGRLFYKILTLQRKLQKLRNQL